MPSGMPSTLSYESAFRRCERLRSIDALGDSNSTLATSWALDPALPSRARFRHSADVDHASKPARGFLDASPAASHQRLNPQENFPRQEDLEEARPESD